jgi:hypothetical protein
MTTQKISAAFVAAQKAFGPALKTNTNPHFKSKYADLSACIEAVIDALHANGIAMIQKTINVESGVCVETVFVHDSGETLSSGPLHVPAAKKDPQGYGSALTYARRYSLMAACGIAPEDDDGNAGTAAKKKQKDDGRLQWLADWMASLSEAASSKDLRERVTKAVTDAKKYNDTDAESKFLAYEAYKIAAAKQKAAA